MAKRPKSKVVERRNAKSSLIRRDLVALEYAPDRSVKAARAGDSTKWERRETPSFMVETHGGFVLESVPGFDSRRALTDGFDSRILPSGTKPDLPATDPYGSYRPESVIHGDDRVPVRNTAGVPWRCICHLVIRREDTSLNFGTGWFVGPRVVITAGHCIYDHRTGWAVETIIIPGRQGDYAPFGYAAAVNVEVDDLWVSSARQDHDYGAFLLADDQLGRAAGWFGFGVYPDDELLSNLANNAGYPADKPFGTMWFNSGRIRDVDAVFLHHLLDTEAGQSGSPIFRKSTTEQRVVVGIHTGAVEINRGRRISPDLYERLARWAAVT